jgi:hypothetical protein
MQPTQPVEIQPVDNPFALLLNPQAIVAHIERSERLQRLHSRVCRPLDKPLIPCADDAGMEGDSLESLAGEA